MVQLAEGVEGADEWEDEFGLGYMLFALALGRSCLPRLGVPFRC